MTFPDEVLMPDEPTLTRLEIMGLLARASRLAMQECEESDGVELKITASASGLVAECDLFMSGVAIQGWMQ